jgi:hypothetical protein
MRSAARGGVTAIVANDLDAFITAGRVDAGPMYQQGA